MTEDPKRLTRQELERIVGRDQRAIRAFEKLFDLIPGDLDSVEIISILSAITAASARNAVDAVKKEITQLQMDLINLQKGNSYAELEKRIAFLESKPDKTENLSFINQRLNILESTKRDTPVGWDKLLNRVEILENLEGL